MTHLLKTSTLLLILFCLSAAPARPGFAQDSDQAQAFLEGVQAYEQGDFARAAEAFLGLAQAGVESGRLYYNLGNAYLRAEDLGRAVLWYERAALLMPADPELRFNLDYARSQTRDALAARGDAQDREAAGGSLLSRVLFFWKPMLPLRTLQILLIACGGVFWLALGSGRVLKNKPGRRLWKSLAGLALAGVLLIAPTVVHLEYHRVARTKAVILAPELAVRSGRSPDATELFTLHAGAEVDLEEEHEGYVRLRFGPDMIGWARADQVERI